MTTAKKSLPADFADPRVLAGFPPGTPLAVAFSGGADSVALLDMLAAERNVFAVHVHHGIRGAEADRDAAFCRETAERLGVPFALLYVDVPALAAQTGESMETAARNARYDAISRWMRKNDIPLLVTAHHADDQLETVLQHLLRGSGTRGLGGIPACRPLGEGLWVARPLLKIPKSTLLKYVEKENLSFVTDSTNNELCCQRNFLRLRVLPLLEELRPGAAAAAARCAEALARDEEYLDTLAAEFLAAEGSEPAITALKQLPAPIFARVMRRLLPIPPESVHLTALRQLLDSQKPHAALSLPPQVRVCVENGHLTVTADEKTPVSQNYLVPLFPGINRIEEANALVIVGTDSKDFPPPTETAYKYAAQLRFDSAIIKGKLFVRPRRAGDTLLTGGMHKAVRRLQASAHLPPAVRERMPIPVDDCGVLGVPFGPVRDGGSKKKDTVIAFYFN